MVGRERHMSEYIRNENEPGIAFCITCKERLKNGSSGKKLLQDMPRIKTILKAEKL